MNNLLFLCSALVAVFLFQTSILRADNIGSVIHSFSEDRPRSVDMGVYRVVDSKSVETALSFGSKAVPELIKSIDSSDPLIVAQAAYCLQRLKEHSAKPYIQDAFANWNAIPIPRTPAAQYAVERLHAYLIDEKQNFR